MNIQTLISINKLKFNENKCKVLTVTNYMSPYS